MSDKPYSPMKAVRRATRAMDSVSRKHAPPSERPLTLTTNGEPVPCAVLLRSFIENGPVPDDFTGLPKTSDALKKHVRPDGAVYKGAFEAQGDRSSVVLVYAAPSWLPDRCESIATMERKALLNRHDAHALGPFARHPQTSVVSPTNAETA